MENRLTDIVLSIWRLETSNLMDCHTTPPLLHLHLQLMR